MPFDLDTLGTALVWLIAVSLWALTAVRLRDLAAVPDLPGPAELARRGRPPRVSVVIAARNEQHRIDRTVRQLIAQRDIDLELIVVDDRSEDRTPELLRELADEFDALEVVRVDTLPDGWLGKPHACQAGADRASGDWLLFLDADVWLTPDVIARAVRAAVHERADHLCLFPGESDASFAARAAMISFSAALIHYAARVRHGNLRYYIGIGAFNLVRAAAYRAVDGHRPLCLEVIDDLMLGRLLGRAGFRTRALIAARDVDVHYGATVSRLIGAVEKNLFALVDYSLPRAVLALGAGGVGMLAAFLAPLAGGVAGLVALAGLLSAWIPSWIAGARFRWGRGAALLSPLMAPLGLVALAGSTWRTLREGGVRWRGTLYPLEELRRARQALLRQLAGR